MNQITLRPSFLYWLLKNIPMFILAGIILLGNSYLIENIIVRYAALLSVICILMYLLYNFLTLLIFTKWIITEEQIKIYKGILLKTIDYIELYRVYDYQERQTFIQAIINNTNLYIYSGDKSNPELKVCGIYNGSAIVQEIRSRVELQKQKKGIYEFTNR